MIRALRAVLAAAAAMALLLVAAVPAQARDWNWTQAQGAPLLVVCKFWHPATPYGPLWEVKSVGINDTAESPVGLSVTVRRGSVQGPVIHHWSVSLTPGQWSSMGTVFVSPVAGDILMTSKSTPAGGAGGVLGMEFVTYC